MASASPELRKSVGHRPLDRVFAQLQLALPAERAAFESLWRQFEGHAALYGCAAHPDVDPEQLDEVRAAVLEQLAGHARRGAIVAVEQHCVRTLMAALRDSGGLTHARPDSTIAELTEHARIRLCEAAQCEHVPVAELFCYHQSLGRHYGVYPERFVELVDWCVAALTSSDPPDHVRRFKLAMQRLRRPPVGPAPEPAARERPLAIELPAEVVACPVALAGFTPAGEQGFSQVLRWHAILREAARAAELDVPALVHNALLVHLLGLEDPGRRAVLADAADRLLVHDFIPLAREVGAKHNRHEPVATELVAVVGAALRPWSFAAPPLDEDQRIVLVALLSELATSKARKLLHQEKRHATSEPVRAAVNRALACLPGRVHAVSPRQRIDRVAAGFRYLNRVRRGSDPRLRDATIVAELVERRR